jgi:hypothetical protein
MQLLPAAAKGPAIRLAVIGWQREIPLLSKAVATKRARTVKRPRHQVAPRLSLGRVVALLRTFRVRRLHVAVDTGNYVYNAQFFPVAYALQRWGWDVGINWWDQNEIQLEVENRFSRLLWAWWFR